MEIYFNMYLRMYNLQPQSNADCTSGDVYFLDEPAYQPNSEELVGDEARINMDEPKDHQNESEVKIMA